VGNPHGPFKDFELRPKDGRRENPNELRFRDSAATNDGRVTVAMMGIGITARIHTLFGGRRCGSLRENEEW
jgi:hypothetical protein